MGDELIVSFADDLYNTLQERENPKKHDRASLSYRPTLCIKMVIKKQAIRHRNKYCKTYLYLHNAAAGLLTRHPAVKETLNPPVTFLNFFLLPFLFHFMCESISHYYISSIQHSNILCIQTCSTQGQPAL